MAKSFNSSFRKSMLFTVSKRRISYRIGFDTAKAVQRFEQQPEYTEINPGEDAKLACRIFNKRGHCSWQKDNKW
ncbi:hypothetical protein J437_LFUL004621 [Ladona fulva]|uniref:Uncharacterized protein n=1 Tax=Ladona fulva TaxID=123851 RepID=A0A8K0K015_LADFU|nr:hypothetical protein J437_LFUL004621 [Ladona fulva]